MAVMTQLEIKELVSFFEERKNLYQFLHILFQEPVYESALLDFSDYSSMNNLSQNYDGGKILAKFINRLSKKAMRQIQDEYKRLFLGPGPLVAPPWESYYRSNEFVLFDECVYKLRKRYNKYGLIFIKEYNEPDDHLLLELEFFIYLLNACLREENPARLLMLINEQISFIENHFVKWIPLFCQRIIDYSSSQLYVGAAMLLTDFLGYDLESLYRVKQVLTEQ